MKWGPQGAFGGPISLREGPLKRFFRYLKKSEKLMQKVNILEGLAIWNVIFRPRRASKTKQILREYGIFAHMKARLYRKTRYDRENHKKSYKTWSKTRTGKLVQKLRPEASI